MLGPTLLPVLGTYLAGLNVLALPVFSDPLQYVDVQHVGFIYNGRGVDRETRQVCWIAAVPFRGPLILRGHNNANSCNQPSPGRAHPSPYLNPQLRSLKWPVSQKAARTKTRKRLREADSGVHGQTHAKAIAMER